MANESSPYTIRQEYYQKRKSFTKKGNILALSLGGVLIANIVGSDYHLKYIAKNNSNVKRYVNAQNIASQLDEDRKGLIEHMVEFKTADSSYTRSIDSIGEQIKDLEREVEFLKEKDEVKSYDAVKNAYYVCAKVTMGAFLLATFGSWGLQKALSYRCQRESDAALAKLNQQ